MLSTACNINNNAKLLQQLKSGFKRATNRNKYQLKVKIERLNQYWDALINPSFQGVNGIFGLSFERKNDRTENTGHFLLKVEIKDCNVMNDEL